MGSGVCVMVTGRPSGSPRKADSRSRVEIMLVRRAYETTGSRVRMRGRARSSMLVRRSFRGLLLADCCLDLSTTGLRSSLCGGGDNGASEGTLRLRTGISEGSKEGCSSASAPTARTSRRKSLFHPRAPCGAPQLSGALQYHASDRIFEDRLVRHSRRGRLQAMDVRAPGRH
ncbi:hypothetical protein BJV77DRAFT_220638 [Russula vinacea]|nr:hypothetical protein BJV77DRAFT_220638 [Russula vinacea]